MTAPAVDYEELLGRLSPAKQKRAEAAIKLLAERPLPDTQYATDPVGWAVNVLKIPEATIRWSLNDGYSGRQWDGTPDPLVAMAESIAQGRDTGVESGTGTGKTFELAWLALWFLVSFEDSLVVTTAPKEAQLTTQLWKEIGRHWARFKRAYPKADTVELRVRLKPGTAESETWGILGYACGVDAGATSATRAQGFHAKHMLIVTEETPGIDPAVMAALTNTCTGAHNLRLAVGNPDHQLDPLHQFCMERGVNHIRVSALDHPNVVTGREVVPGAVSQKGLDRLLAAWGEGSPMYESRVRGISPAEAADSLIKLEWCEAAAAKYNSPLYATAKIAKGVDVAQSLNGDKAAIATWNGACLMSVRAFQCDNATVLGRNVFAEMEREGVDAAHVGVDSVGLGAATVNELREKPGGYAVNALNGGAAPISNAGRAADGSSYEWVSDENLFNNLRSQMYWQMREDLRLGRVALPNNPALFRELTTPTYRTHNGKTVIEAKDQIRKRLGNSPDMADAVVYGNWVRPRLPLPTQDLSEPLFGRDRTPREEIWVPIDSQDSINTGSGQSLGWGF